MGHPLFFYDTYDVSVYHSDPSKSVCRIIVVPKKGLALRKRAYGGLGDVGCI